MRRTGPLLLLATLTAFTAVAEAQDPLPPVDIKVDAKVTPNVAGTPAKPQGVKLGVDAHIETAPEVDPPLVQKVDVLFPRGGVYNGGRFPSCSENTLDRRGVSACPKGAVMGSGRGTATADSVPTYPKITVVNGGPNRVYFYTVMTNPARVQAPVVGKVTKLSGQWSYRLSATIPRSLQIVAGVPIRLSRLQLTAGSKDWLATTGCPASRKWAYRTEVTFVDGRVVEYDGTVPCRSR